MGSKKIELCGRVEMRRSILFDDVGIGKKVCSFGSSSVVCVVRCV